MASKRKRLTFTLEDVLTARILDMEARNMAPETTLLYRQVVGYLQGYLEARGVPPGAEEITREHVQGYFKHVLSAPSARGRPLSATTADIRFRTLRAFFNWAVADGWIASSPMIGMQRPKQPLSPKPHFEIHELRRLLEVCRGSDFDRVRDMAIIRFFIATGCRLEEVSNLLTMDLNIRDRRANVTGKGRRSRTVRIGAKAVATLHKYVLLRSQHEHAGEPWLWIGRRGRLTSGGVSQMLRRRLSEAGLPHSGAHKFRHSFAHWWRHRNGSVVDLEILMGWSPNSPMSRHYGASAMAETALDHAATRRDRSSRARSWMTCDGLRRRWR